MESAVREGGRGGPSTDPARANATRKLLARASLSAAAIRDVFPSDGGSTSRAGERGSDQCLRRIHMRLLISTALALTVALVAAGPTIDLAAAPKPQNIPVAVRFSDEASNKNLERRKSLVPGRSRQGCRVHPSQRQQRPDFQHQYVEPGRPYAHVFLRRLRPCGNLQQSLAVPERTVRNPRQRVGPKRLRRSSQWRDARDADGAGVSRIRQDRHSAGYRSRLLERVSSTRAT